MLFQRFVSALLLACALPVAAIAQSGGKAPSPLHLELNAFRDVDAACRLTFIAQNETGLEIEKAVFETVIFDTSGGVVSLSLFDFRDLPADRPRVRQFDVQGMTCGAIGKALINGANSCVVNGAESEICDEALSLRSRLEVELLG
jgi:hypothetical protein